MLTPNSSRISNFTKPFFSEAKITDSLKCCIEEVLSDVNPLELSITRLESLLKPCDVYQSDHTSIVQQALMYFVPVHKENKPDHHPVCREFYCDKSTSGWMVLYMTTLAVTLFISLFGNTFACYVIVRVRSLRRLVTYQLLLSLAVSDLLVSLFVIPIKISTASTNMVFCSSLTICRLFNTTDIMFFTASVTHLLVITIDRYLSITKPYFYKCQRVKRFYRVVIAAVWFYALLWAVTSNFNLSTLSFQDAFTVERFHCRRQDFLLPRLLYIIVFLVPCSVMLYMNKTIWSIAVKQGNEIERQKERCRSKFASNEPDSSLLIVPPPASMKQNIKSKIIGKLSNSNSDFLKNHKSEFRATKVMLSVFGIFAICWIPVISITLTYTFTPLKINRVVFLIFCDFLPNFHSCLNPFIYCFFHKEFMNGLKKMWTRMSFVAKHKMSMKKRRNCKTMKSRTRLQRRIQTPANAAQTGVKMTAEYLL